MCCKPQIAQAANTREKVLFQQALAQIQALGHGDNGGEAGFLN